MRVKVDPLIEIILKKTFGINTVPAKERTKMIIRTCTAVLEYHNKEIEKINNERPMCYWDEFYCGVWDEDHE